MILGLDLPAVARAALIYAHLLAFATAAVAIAFGEFAIFAQRQVNAHLLKKSSHVVSLALAALWVTGTVVIWLDTRFDLNTIAGNGKLLTKLTVVAILTVNGLLLHWLAFPRITGVQPATCRAATLPAALGGVSAATWFYAAFIGVAKPLAPLGYTGLMALYFIELTVAMGIAWVFVRPRLACRIEASGTTRSTDGRHSVPRPAATSLRVIETT